MAVIRNRDAGTKKNDYMFYPLNHRLFRRNKTKHARQPAMEGLEVVLTLAGGAIVRVKTGRIITRETRRGHSNIVAAVVPEGVTTIGASAFDLCSSLDSVTIPEGVTTIGAYAFRGCTSLTSLTIPEGVTTIGDAAFRGCTSLASVTIP